MKLFDQRFCTWGGPFCALFFGAGLFLAGFIPPPSPNLSANEVAAFYQSDPNKIRGGMLLGLSAIAGGQAWSAPLPRKCAACAAAD